MKFLSAAFVFLAASALADPAPRFPLLRFDSTKIKIPQFYFQRREFRAGIPGRFQPRLMTSDGQMQPLADSDCSPSQAPIWGLEFVSPSKNWKVAFKGWSAEEELAKGSPLSLQYRLDPSAEPKSLKLPSWGYTFAPEPLAFDDAAGIFYFMVSDGPLENRRRILLRFDLKSAELTEIGKTAGMDPQLSPDHRWILWSSGEIYTAVGDLSLRTWNLNIYSMDARESYGLSSGASQNNFCGWKNAENAK